MIFALHCIAWPYNDKYPWANKIETVLLLSLVILANTQSLENDNTRHAVSIFILVVTYTFAVLFSAYKAARFFRKWYEKRKNGQQQRERMVSHESINTSL